MKNCLCPPVFPSRKSRQKVLLCMKLSFIIVLAACLQVSAKGYSQDEASLTLHYNDIKLSRAFTLLERKTNCRFLYSDDIVPVNKRINLLADNTPLSKVLKSLLRETDLHFRMLDNHVIVIARNGVDILETRVTGTVTNAQGEPLTGVTVQVKGTNTGTVTDANGKYSLNVPDNATLVFSYIGYETAEMATNGQSTLNVTLQISSSTLNELIVTGYTTQLKKDLTGSVTVVDVSDMTKQPSGTVTKQLQGQASGVTVIGSGQPGEDPQIRIRGVNTFGNNTPLYVVDGVPTQNIADLNPNDVASIQVLKDAGAASIYGARASNGVLIITTRKGKGKVQVSYNAYYGTQRPQNGNAWNTLSPMEMARLKFMALSNSGTPVTAAKPDPLYGGGPEPVLPDYIVPAGASEGDPAVDPAKYYVNPNYTSLDDFNSFYRITRANKNGTDWFHEVFKPAPITSHNLTVSGGGEKGNYLLSLNYFNQQGTLMGTHLKRYSVRANTEFKLNDHIRIGENLSYTITDNPQIDALTEGSAVGMAIRMQPIVPVYDIMGNYGGTYGAGQLGNAQNPVAIQERTRNNRGYGNRLFGNLYAEIDFLRHFTARTSFGGESFAGASHSFTFPEYERSENTTNNTYNESSYWGYNWTWTNTLQYQQVFNEIHDLKLLVGTEAYNNSGRDLSGTAQGYFSFDPNFVNLSTGTTAKNSNSSEYSDGLFSLIGRLDYSFRDRYLISATVRRDGSSKFKTYQYGWFPSVTAGWRLSEENFLQDVSWITDLKVRGGWGIMGNQINADPANPYTTFAENPTSSYYDIAGTGIVPGFQRARIGAPDAKWEKDINANIGVDATLFKGALELTADYYWKNIKDMLFNPTLPGTAGAGTVPFINVAKMKNTGVDISARYTTQIASDWKLDATVSFTTYNNKILQVSGVQDYFDLDGRRFNGQNIIRNAVGQPVSSFFGYKIIGFWNSDEEVTTANEQVQKATGDTTAVYQTQAAKGRFRYADISGPDGKPDGRITADDRTFLGNPNPDFSYGLNLGLTYRNFDFSVFFYGVHGNEIWNNVRWWRDFYASFGGGKSKTALYDSWRPDHHDATAPIQENSGTFSTNTVPNSYFVENGAYFRAKNMMLGYTLPAHALERIGVDKLRIYVQAANLFTVTKYSGIDPEIAGSGVTDFGVDEGAYPTQREFLFGINLSF